MESDKRRELHQFRVPGSRAITLSTASPREYELSTDGITTAAGGVSARRRRRRLIGSMTVFRDSPTVAANLDAALVKSLAPIPGMRAGEMGIQYGNGHARADHQARGGRQAASPRSSSTCPLRPVSAATPPGLAPFFDPWLGQVDPLVLDSLSKFRPGPPPAIASPLYVEEFEEVRDYGVSMNSRRSPGQRRRPRSSSPIPRAAMQAVRGASATCRHPPGWTSATARASSRRSIRVAADGDRYPSGTPSLDWAGGDRSPPSGERGRYRRRPRAAALRRSLDPAPSLRLPIGRRLAGAGCAGLMVLVSTALPATRIDDGRVDLTPARRRGRSHPALRRCRCHAAGRNRRARLV